MRTNIDVSQPGYKLTPRDYLHYLGPGAIMAAAVVGPGTVTTASSQGATYGFTSMWIIAIACIIAYFYQEPATRVAIGCKTSVMAGIRDNIGGNWSRFSYCVVFFGSTAHQAGNLVGASMALSYFVPGTSTVFWAAVVAAIALVIVMLNRYAILENINTVLILCMVLAFVITMFISGPSVTDIVTEGFSFNIPGGRVLLLLALMGTTVMPDAPLSFSGFLLNKHPDAKGSKNEIKLCRFDLKLNMILTFLITSSILICAATLLHPRGIEVASAGDMAQALVPLLGRFAGVFFSLGLAAASISSALYRITIHPMLMNTAFGREVDLTAPRSRVIAVVVAAVPVVLIGLWGGSPVSMIILAQALYGILLPLLVILVWRLCANEEFMGEYVNTRAQNIIQGCIFVFTLFFSLQAIYTGVILRLLDLLA